MIPTIAFFGLLASGADAAPTTYCPPPLQTIEWTGWGRIIVTWEPQCYPLTKGAKR